MPTYLNPQAWSKTAASNDGADSAFGTIADTSYPRPVLDWYRGDMAAAAKYADDVGGALVAGGSANALTVTTNQNLSSAHLAAGLCLVVRASEANTSATVTFSPDGITAANIKCSDGSSLGIGQIKAGMPLMLFYNAGSSEWRAANLISGSAGDLGSTTASFLATKSGVDQALSGLAMKITFPVVVFNNGQLYSASTSRWTPPAGKVLVRASVLIDSHGQGGASIYKNGAEYKTARGPFGEDAGGTADAATTSLVSVVDSASGTDYYEIYWTTPYAGEEVEGYVYGQTYRTWFSGTMV